MYTLYIHIYIHILCLCNIYIIYICIIYITKICILPPAASPATNSNIGEVRKNVPEENKEDKAKEDVVIKRKDACVIQ